MPEILRAPFPWFGGKALAADLIWGRSGISIGTYVEPFFGSGAVLLNAPKGLNFAITLNDIDCQPGTTYSSTVLKKLALKVGQTIAALSDKPALKKNTLNSKGYSMSVNAYPKDQLPLVRLCLQSILTEI